MAERSTTRRDRHRAHHRREGGPCHLCGQPIDYDLPHLHPMAFVIDHIVPLARGGEDVLANTASAHRSCNRDKSDKMPGDKPRRKLAAYVTGRTW